MTYRGQIHHPKPRQHCGIVTHREYNGLVGNLEYEATDTASRVRHHSSGDHVWIGLARNSTIPDLNC